MNNETQPNQEPGPDASLEALPGPEPPRIYVASLSDYNAGHLYGNWIDAAQDDDQVFDAINKMLAESPRPEAEEFAIHDYEGFGTWQPSEYETISTVTAVARAIEEHGPAIAAWVGHIGLSAEAAIESFEDAYLGTWKSMVDYAETLAEDMAVRITVEPESWSHYVRFDTEALARDLTIEMVTAPDSDGGIFVFDPRGG